MLKRCQTVALVDIDRERGAYKSVSRACVCVRVSHGTGVNTQQQKEAVGGFGVGVVVVVGAGLIGGKQKAAIHLPCDRLCQLHHCHTSFSSASWLQQNIKCR